MYLNFIAFFCVSRVFANAASYYEGESCIKDGKAGSCVILGNCNSAIADLRNRKSPQICSFAGREPIVCCLDNLAAATTTPAPPVLTTPKRPATTTEYIPKVEDYQLINKDGVGDCRPIAANLTSPKTGKKAWDKCLEYQEKYVYPCGESAALSLGKTRLNHCHHKTDELIIGGKDAARWEYPHMVLLGFGDTPGNWVCAGTLISNRFILTAGHCTYSRDHASNVTYARIGVLSKNSALEEDQVYKITNIIKYPDYKPPIKYHDLALLQTETPMKLDQYTVPACLDVGLGVVDDDATATGWGLTKYNGKPSEVLQKVNLKKFSNAECSTFFRPGDRNMKAGYQAASQMCYGHKVEARDTCQGDSGGPLQVKNRKINCIYTIIGITSFGRGCGTIGIPAIYTRISNYVGWIENIVWS